MNIENNRSFSVAEVVPHAGKMILIDRIVGYGKDYLVAAVHIGDSTLFLQKDKVPVWVGIEYMAQAIAAYAGVQAKLNQQPIKIGFLLGTRLYQATASEFKKGTELIITVKELIRNEQGLGVFACQIKADNVEVTANINVFQPDDVQAFGAELT